MSQRLPDEGCFRGLPVEERIELEELQLKYSKPYDVDQYAALVKALERASLYVSACSTSAGLDGLPDVRKETLAIKCNALSLFLDKDHPPWAQQIEATLKYNVLNILKLFLNKCKLDLSVFCLIDKTIDHPEIIKAYHDYVGTHYLKTYTGVRIYHVFYNKKFKAMETRGVLRYHQDTVEDETQTKNTNKKALSGLPRELKRMRSFSDFLRSGKRMRIFRQASSAHNMFIMTDSELLICLPPIDSMMRGLKGVISVDYRINVFLASYLATLSAFIPTYQDFVLAKQEGMFELDMQYSQFKSLCTNSFVQVDDYDEHLYLFVQNANRYFYQYFNAFWRDLTNKLMFEPVTFYLTFMATVFSLLSLIQVLQNAKIIPPLPSSN